MKLVKRLGDYSQWLKKYRQLKESIRIMNSQRSDAEKISLIEEGKKIGINEGIKHNGLLITV